MELLELKMRTDLDAALPAVIDFNFDELETALSAQVEHYNHLIVTEDTVREGKEDLANLRKLREAIDTSRKDTKKRWNQPLADYEARMKKLTALIDAPISVIDRQIKTFAEQERAEKASEIEAVYDELVPDNLREIIPLQRIMDPRWLNKTTTMKSIREAIETKITRTKVDMALIDGVNPNYMAAVRTKYIETLDVGTALDYQDELLAAEERFKQQEAARAQRAAQRAAWEGQRPKAEEQPPVAVQEPVREPVPLPRQDNNLYDLILEFRLTQPQATALKQFLEANHINYTKLNYTKIN